MRSAIVNFPLKRASLLAIAAFTFFSFAGTMLAQSAELSLADLLIGLRSKKATLEERNSILTEAISNRGVTFSLTPEIEKELMATGAAKPLIDSIRAKMKVASVVAKPVEPPPPDFLFYEKRATANVTLGNLDLAVTDFSKAIDMNSAAYPSYLGRGGVYAAKKLYDLSITDFSKVIDGQPTNVDAFTGRGNAYESLGKLELAEKDFAQAVSLKPDDENSKASVARVRAEMGRIAESLKPKPVPVEVKLPQPRPEFVDAGTLTEANAIKMVKPVYSQIAARSNIFGKVVVEVTLDEAGNVVEAKAISGPQMLRGESEAAANRSKFNPVLFESKPIKARGTIVYNFVNRQ